MTWETVTKSKQLSELSRPASFFFVTPCHHSTIHLPPCLQIPVDAQDFAEQCLTNIASRFGEAPLILSYDLFRKDWQFDQEALIGHAKTLAEYWKVDSPQLVTSLRHLMAIRDTVAQRSAFQSAAALWLAVVQEAGVQNNEDPGHKVLCSFLLGHTQSAACERTFAKVVEMQTLAISCQFLSDDKVPGKNFCRCEKFIFRRTLVGNFWVAEKVFFSVFSEPVSQEASR